MKKKLYKKRIVETIFALRTVENFGNEQRLAKNESRRPLCELRESIHSRLGRFNAAELRRELLRGDQRVQGERRGHGRYDRRPAPRSCAAFLRISGKHRAHLGRRNGHAPLREPRDHVPRTRTRPDFSSNLANLLRFGHVIRQNSRHKMLLLTGDTPVVARTFHEILADGLKIAHRGKRSNCQTGA